MSRISALGIAALGAALSGGIIGGSSRRHRNGGAHRGISSMVSVTASSAHRLGIGGASALGGGGSSHQHRGGGARRRKCRRSA